MTRVRGDYLPPEITAGELAAIADADLHGIITPPLFDCLETPPPLRWGLAHLRYLERRGIARRGKRRADGLYSYELTT